MSMVNALPGQGGVLCGSVWDTSRPGGAAGAGQGGPTRPTKELGMSSEEAKGVVHLLSVAERELGHCEVRGLPGRQSCGCSNGVNRKESRVRRGFGESGSLIAGGRPGEPIWRSGGR